MAKKTPVVKKRNPQDATRKKDVDPIRRRLEALEQKVAKLEAWAGTVADPAMTPTRYKA